MVELINAITSDEVKQWEQHFRSATVVVADTETNGLFLPKGAYAISISMYFPEHDIAYNLPFYHGQGRVEHIGWNKENGQPRNIRDMTWQGHKKKQLFKDFWWSAFAEGFDFENMDAVEMTRVMGRRRAMRLAAAAGRRLWRRIVCLRERGC